MQETAFQQILLLGRLKRRGKLGLYVLGMAHAALLAVVLLSLALAVNLLVRGDAAPAGNAAGFLDAIWLATQSLHLPSENLAWLAALVVVGLAAAAASAVVATGLVQSALRQTTAVARGLYYDLFQQQKRLGGKAAFDLGDAPPQDLLDGPTELLRRELAAIWSALALSWATIPLFLALAVAVHLWLALSAVLLAIPCWYLFAQLEQRAESGRRLHHDRANRAKRRLHEERTRLEMHALFGASQNGDESLAGDLDEYFDELAARDGARVAVRQLGIWALVSGVLFIVGLAGVNILRDPPRLSVAETLLLMASLGLAGSRARTLLRLWQTAPEVERASRLVVEFLNRTPEDEDAQTSVKLKPLSESIEFADVSYVDAAGATLLDQVSFRLQARQRIAVLASGSRTAPAVANLLMRFTEPSSGKISYDGVDLAKANTAAVRRQASAVLEDGIFPGTVSDNISCRDERYTSLAISEAAKLAHAYQFVQRLPQGFATEIGEHGLHLDAGEVLRVGLARALLRDSPLIVVQEPDAVLDPDIEQMLDDTLTRVGRDRTLVILATRLATLRNADLVLLFHDGRLHDSGTHADLLQRSELYRHLNYLKFNDFRRTMPAAERRILNPERS